MYDTFFLIPILLLYLPNAAFLFARVGVSCSMFTALCPRMCLVSMAFFFSSNVLCYKCVPLSPSNIKAYFTQKSNLLRCFPEEF